MRAGIGVSRTVDSDAAPWGLRESEFPAAGSERERLAFLLRYVVLAPSSHNSQPWRFRVGEERIEVLADRSRWLRVADPDQRELHISLGCAIENLLVAAERFGYRHALDYSPAAAEGEHVATVALTRVEPTGGGRSELLEAIPRRFTPHAPFEDRDIPEAHRGRLEAAAREPGVTPWLSGDPAVRQRMGELTVRADALQFADPAWRAELGHWLGQGAFGTPWLIARLGQLAVTYLDLGRSMARKDAERLSGAPLLGILATGRDGREAQLRVGQAFQRLALTATTIGVGVHPMSQVLERPELKAELAALLPSPGLVPQHVFRLGYPSKAEAHTPRRPLADVLAS